MGKIAQKIVEICAKVACTLYGGGIQLWSGFFVRKNKTEVCERVKHTIKPNLDEFVFRQFFLKYCKLSNFKLLNGQLFV